MAHRFEIVTMHPGSLLDDSELERITRTTIDALRQIGGEPVPADAARDGNVPLFLLVATGGSERVILDWWAEHGGASTDQPLWLIGHSGNNSLPAALEVLARLQQDGTPGRIFYLDGCDDTAGLAEIADSIHDLVVRRRLRRARFGVVGSPSDWLVASMPDAVTVHRSWGPTVVPVNMDEVVALLNDVADADVEPHVADLTSHATEVREPSARDLHDVVRVYLALKRIVASHELDALTVRCFDLVLDRKTTGCVGLARLTDDGVIAGCEGDLVSTIGLYWARELLAATPWMANPAQLDPGNDTLWLAHCTVPPSLVQTLSLRSHFESGLGVAIQGAMPPGPVTLLRIGGRKLDRVWLAEGEVLRSGTAENLCRTQVEIRLTRGGNVGDLLRTPLGNHLVLVAGHHLERLRSWCDGASVQSVSESEGQMRLVPHR